MFTAGEIDKVMSQGGYDDDSIITIFGIREIVAAAQNCGVLDDRIHVWKLDDESEFLITFDLDDNLRLCSRSTSGLDLLSYDESARDAVLRLLCALVDIARDLERGFRERTA